MALETATYISGLNSSNPVGATDPKSQGDDHLRLIKTTLLNTFPNVTGAVTATQAELNLLDGVTASTDELNILDGVTVTAAELNRVDALVIEDIAALTDPGADSLLLWDDSDGALEWATEIADSFLSSNVPLKDVSNALTEEGNPQIVLRADSHPWIRFEDTDAATDAGHWDIIATASGFLFRKIDDDNSNATAFIDVDVTGNNVDSLAFTADAITANGSAILTAASGVALAGTQTISGAKTFSADITLSGTRTIDATTRLNVTGATVSVGESGGDLGFYGSAGDGKPTVVGAREDNGSGNIPALASLLGALQSLGLITDNTTP